MLILVTGATGTLGTAVVPRLLADGHRVRATSRRPRSGGEVEWRVADLADGAGLDTALAGVAAVVHLATGGTGGRRTARVDVAGTRRLVDAAATAGVRQLNYVSIVGIDRVPLAYYRHKLAAERVVRAGAVPWSILRATQFPQLLDELLTRSSLFGTVVGDRNVLAQPVDPRDVADRIAGLVAAGPTGRIEDFAGPEVIRFSDAVRDWSGARGRRGRLLPVRLPGRLGRELRAGGLTNPGAAAGRRTWHGYLADTYGGSGAGSPGTGARAALR
ncbi:SDR family oxidoreductase [Plantactinospora siamensis]|uniref:SDR family oxidoreductase n=1 Tax=Plantactinospora siamensis TaxID=555372 RepID=A0ABV6NQW4_9ACTN